MGMPTSLKLGTISTSSLVPAYPIWADLGLAGLHMLFNTLWLNEHGDLIEGRWSALRLLGRGPGDRTAVE